MDRGTRGTTVRWVAKSQTRLKRRTADSHDEARAHCGLGVFQTSLCTLFRFKLFSNNIVSVGGRDFFILLQARKLRHREVEYVFHSGTNIQILTRQLHRFFL